MFVTRRRLLEAAAVGSIALAGCASEDGGGGGAQPGTGTETQTETSPSDDQTGTAGDQAGTTVEMVDTSFDPVRVSVAPGTAVEWVNRDGFQHDVTATQFHDAAASWNFSETVSGSDSTSYTFDEAGVYEYYCSIHGEGAMCGVVLVGDASLDSALPCEDGGGGDDGGAY